MLQLDMLLKEIFDTKHNVSWIDTENNHAVLIKINSDNFIIYIDKYQMGNITLAEVGFKKNGSYELSNNSINPSKVIGVIVNMLSEKLEQIDVDFIFIEVNESLGDVHGRKSLYDSICTWLRKKQKLMYVGEWLSLKDGWVKILSRKTPDDQMLIKVQNKISELSNK